MSGSYYGRQISQRALIFLLGGSSEALMHALDDEWLRRCQWPHGIVVAEVHFIALGVFPLDTFASLSSQSNYHATNPIWLLRLLFHCPNRIAELQITADVFPL